MTGTELIQIERSMWMRKEKHTYQDILICIGLYVNNNSNIGLTTVTYLLMLTLMFTKGCTYIFIYDPLRFRNMGYVILYR